MCTAVVATGSVLGHHHRPRHVLLQQRGNLHRCAALNVGCLLQQAHRVRRLELAQLAAEQRRHALGHVNVHVHGAN